MSSAPIYQKRPKAQDIDIVLLKPSFAKQNIASGCDFISLKVYFVASQMNLRYLYHGHSNTLESVPLKCYSVQRTSPSGSPSLPYDSPHKAKMQPLTAKALVASGLEGCCSVHRMKSVVLSILRMLRTVAGSHR